MSKFISHLKTVLPRNFADRGWSPMVNGKRSRVAAHWEYLVPVNGAFVKGDRPMTEGGTFSPPQPIENQIWTCIKSQCEEGGLMEFEDFWNPPQPPDGNCDNTGSNNNTPQSPLHFPQPHESAESGSTVQGGSIFVESLKQRNSGGVHPGSTVKSIGSALEKNKISVLSEPFLEKPSEEIFISVLESGQDEYKVDSCNLTQDKVDYEDYPHLTCDNIDAKRNQAEDIKERLLKAQTKQDLTLIREEYSGRFYWVWKNLLTKAQRRSLKAIAAIEQLNLLDATSSPASSNLESACLDNPANPIVVESEVSTNPELPVVVESEVSTNPELPVVVESEVSTNPELPVFQKRDRVITPQGEGEILYFNEHFEEYNVAFAFSTEYFKPEELTLIVGATPKSVSVDYETEDDEIEEEF